MQYLDQIYLEMVFSVYDGKTNVHHHFILDIQISVGTDFTSKKNFWISKFKFAHKKAICLKKQKNEHHHWIVNILNILGIKFYMKLTISVFGTKFSETGLCGFKIGKTEQYHWLLHFSNYCLGNLWS